MYILSKAVIYRFLSLTYPYPSPTTFKASVKSPEMLAIGEVVVGHIFNPSSQRAEAGTDISVTLRPMWST